MIKQKNTKFRITNTKYCLLITYNIFGNLNSFANICSYRLECYEYLFELACEMIHCGLPLVHSPAAENEYESNENDQIDQSVVSVSDTPTTRSLKENVDQEINSLQHQTHTVHNLNSMPLRDRTDMNRKNKQGNMLAKVSFSL